LSIKKIVRFFIVSSFILIKKRGPTDFLTLRRENDDKYRGDIYLVNLDPKMLAISLKIDLFLALFIKYQ
jgi:hypothetical protein